VEEQAVRFCMSMIDHIRSYNMELAYRMTSPRPREPMSR
jgi:hypothetical protein